MRDLNVTKRLMQREKSIDIDFGTPSLGRAVTDTLEVLDWTQASGMTLIPRHPVEGDVVTLTEGTDFDAEVDNETTADNLAAAITGIGFLTGTADGAVVTIVSNETGNGSNGSIFVSSNEAAIPTVGPIDGGVDEDTIEVNGSVFTYVDSSPGADEYSTAAELAALIDGLAGLSATETDGIITVTCDDTGHYDIFLGEHNLGTTAFIGTYAGKKYASDSFISDYIDFDSALGLSPSSARFAASIKNIKAKDPSTPQIRVIVQASYFPDQPKSWEDSAGILTFTDNGYDSFAADGREGVSSLPGKAARFKIEFEGDGTIADLAATFVIGFGG